MVKQSKCIVLFTFTHRLGRAPYEAAFTTNSAMHYPQAGFYGSVCNSSDTNRKRFIYEIHSFVSTTLPPALSIHTIAHSNSAALALTDARKEKSPRLCPNNIYAFPHTTGLHINIHSSGLFDDQL